MAEAVGLAASIIQIAGAGLTLSKALYVYVDSTTKADNEVADIASDIEITANALDSVGKVFEDEDSASVVSKKAIRDAENIVKRCEAVFGEIQQVIDKRRKTGKDGKKSLTMIGKLAWPMKTEKVELLRRRLESLKNSLVLLFHVLQLANGQAKGRLEKDKLEAEREKIRELHQRQQDSIKSLEALEIKLKKVAISDQETLYGSTSPSRTNSVQLMTLSSSLLSEETKHSSNNQNTPLKPSELVTTDDSDFSGSETVATDDEVEIVTAEELAQCAKQVQKLLKRISTLQKSFEATSPRRLPKRRVQKLYQRFCQKFESNVAPRADTSTQLLPPLPPEGLEDRTDRSLWNPFRKTTTTPLASVPVGVSTFYLSSLDALS